MDLAAGVKPRTRSFPDQAAADPVVRDQDYKHGQERGDICPVDPFRQPVRHQYQARLEMDKNEVEEDQPQVDDLFLQVQQPFVSLNLRRAVLGIRTGSSKKNGFGQDQKRQEKQSLSDRIDKEGRGSLSPYSFRAPNTGPERHFLRQPGIGIDGHYPRHRKEKPGGEGQ